MSTTLPIHPYKKKYAKSLDIGEVLNFFFKRAGHLICHGTTAATFMMLGKSRPIDRDRKTSPTQCLYLDCNISNLFMRPTSQKSCVLETAANFSSRPGPLDTANLGTWSTYTIVDSDSSPKWGRTNVEKPSSLESHASAATSPLPKHCTRPLHGFSLSNVS